MAKMQSTVFLPCTPLTLYLRSCDIEHRDKVPASLADDFALITRTGQRRQAGEETRPSGGCR